jgi:hypothetical protein
MACQIAYGSNEVTMNNAQFSSLIDFVIQIGSSSASSDKERLFVGRMMRLSDTEFWPGRGIRIEEDFPELDEKKFWARVFLDTARAIFDRRIGIHEHHFWQAQRIYQAYGSGRLFVEAVRSQERNWFPDSIDGQEFDRVVNQKP